MGMREGGAGGAAGGAYLVWAVPMMPGAAVVPTTRADPLSGSDEDGKSGGAAELHLPCKMLGWGAMRTDSGRAPGWSIPVLVQNPTQSFDLEPCADPILRPRALTWPDTFPCSSFVLEERVQACTMRCQPQTNRVLCTCKTLPREKERELKLARCNVNHIGQFHRQRHNTTRSSTKGVRAF